MKKEFLIITVAVIFIILAGFFYYLKKPTVLTPDKKQNPSRAATEQTPNTLPFNTNDNLDQAFSELKNLQEAEIQ